MTEIKYKIRNALISDIIHLNRIIHSAYRTESSHFTESHLIISPRATPESLSLLISKTETLLYVYELNHTVVGCIQVEEIEGTCLLGQLAVDPPYQGKGIGRQLMEYAINVAKMRGHLEACIWVLKVREDIIQWYKKLGFVWNGKTLPFVHTNTYVKDLVFHIYTKNI